MATSIMVVIVASQKLRRLFQSENFFQGLIHCAGYLFHIMLKEN